MDDDDITEHHIWCSVFDCFSGFSRFIANGWVQSYADFDNQRKQLMRNMDQTIFSSIQKLLNAFLPTLDAIEEGVKFTQDDGARDGLLLIQQTLLRGLKEQGVSTIDTVAVPFDPIVHEVIATCPSSDHTVRMVQSIVAKGYQYNGRVMRAAKVVVTVAVS
jgi:molecular chaperone GrpE